MKLVSIRSGVLSNKDSFKTVPARVVRESSLSVTVKLLVGVGAYKAGDLVDLMRWEIIEEGEKIQ